MEDKKPDELNDEALDKVAGGAEYKYDVLTKKWYVYRKNGRMHLSCDRESEAIYYYRKLQAEEDEKQQQQQPIRPVEFPGEDF